MYHVTAQDKWQGVAIRPRFWNVLTCNWNTYCCRAEGDTKDCCNSSVLSTATPVIGLPTPAAAMPETVTLSVGMAGGSTGLPTTHTAETAAGAWNTACPSAAAVEHCQGSSKIIAGVGASLGTLLIASLLALGFLMRRQKELGSGPALAKNSAARGHEMSLQMPQEMPQPTHTVIERSHELVAEPWR